MSKKLMVLLVAVMILPVVSNAAYYDSPLTADDKTIALYHFDMSLEDSGPLGLDLQAIGGWTYESGVSLEWLPNSDPAFVTSWFSGGFTGNLTPGIALPPSKEFSVEMWTAVRTPNPYYTGFQPVVSQDGGLALGVDFSENGGKRMRLYAGNGTWDSTVTNAELFTTTTFEDNEWHHVKFVHTGTALELYVDGVKEIDYAYTEAVGGGNNLSLGAWNYGYPGFNGFIDEFRIQDLSPDVVLLEGDANRDGVVSAGDYASVQANFGATGDPNDPELYGDANLDGVVSAGDYASVQANFGSTTGSGIVPEPATLGLVSVGFIGLLRRNRK